MVLGLSGAHGLSAPDLVEWTDNTPGQGTAPIRCPHTAARPVLAQNQKPQVAHLQKNAKVIIQILK